MVQFPWYPSLNLLLFQFRVPDFKIGAVSQFGDPGITGCLLLPRAYRSLPRPSSAPVPRHPLYTLSILTAPPNLQYSIFKELPYWRWPDLNRRPPACKAGVLPAELHPHNGPSWIRTTDLRVISTAL